MRKEGDFSKGKRGAFWKHFPPGTTIVALDEELRPEFATETAVNRALRSIVRERRKKGIPLRAHLDFATGKRGSFLKRFPTGMMLVVLAEDVRKEFPTAKQVNKALRSLARTKRRGRTAV